MKVSQITLCDLCKRPIDFKYAQLILNMVEIKHKCFGIKYYDQDVCVFCLVELAAIKELICQ